MARNTARHGAPPPSGQAKAAMLAVPYHWSPVVVPGVAHEGIRMSAFAPIIGLAAPGASSAPRASRER